MEGAGEFLGVVYFVVAVLFLLLKPLLYSLFLSFPAIVALWDHRLTQFLILFTLFYNSEIAQISI
jgi:hypothetical protein